REGVAAAVERIARRGLLVGPLVDRREIGAVERPYPLDAGEDARRGAGIDREGHIPEREMRILVQAVDDLTDPAVEVGCRACALGRQREGGRGEGDAGSADHREIPMTWPREDVATASPRRQIGANSP